jgi:peptidoglycan/LPS O-acetylase OafA/YrhL
VTDHATASSSPALSPAGGVRVLRKIDALDGFRGVAVLLIIVHHLPVAVPSTFHRYTKGGGFGVDAFFVLSGFLITAILLREQNGGGRVRFGAFYRRRALRLLPALIVFLAIYVFYETVTNLPKHHEPASALSILFYYSNTWLHRMPMSVGLGQMWSLAVEEQFYLLWPVCLVLFFGPRRKFTPTVLLMIGLIAAVALRRSYLWDHGARLIPLYTALFTRADALLVGCLLAQFWVRGKLPTRGMQIAGWIGLAYFAYVVRRGVSDSFLYRGGGFTLIAVSVGFILVAVLQTNFVVNRFLRLPGLMAVGRVSYGLYIWHLAVFNAVIRYGRYWNPWVQTIVALGVSAIVTYGSWTLVERPFLRWKDRLDRADREQRDREKPASRPRSSPPSARDRSFRHVALPAPD